MLIMIMTRSVSLSVLFSSLSVFAGCPLCYDSTDPPDLTLTPKALGGSTCADLLSLAESAVSSECENYANMGLYCGCPVPEGRCPLCHDKSKPPDPTLKPEQLGGYTCQEMVAFAANVDLDLNDTFTCASVQALGTAHCGCPIPKTDCPICFDGSLPPDPSYVPTTLGSATCQQLMAYLTTRSTTSCKTLLVAGAFCKCPLPKDVCNLCEDGSDLPNPDTKLGENTCDMLEKFSLFDKGENCTADQATWGVYCGCQNPQASAGFCRICGDDTLLPQPGLLVQTREYNNTCAEIESNTESNLGRPALSSCTELRSEYASICCVGADAGGGGGEMGNSTSNNSSEGNVSAVAPTKAPTTGNSSGTVSAVTTAWSPICVLSATFVLGALTLFV